MTTEARPITDMQGAALLGVSKSQWRRYVARGCPKDERGATAWAAKNLVRRVRRSASPVARALRGATLRDMRSQADAAGRAEVDFEENTWAPIDAAQSWLRMSALVQTEAARIIDIAPDLAALSDPAFVRERLLTRILECRRAATLSLEREARRSSRQPTVQTKPQQDETLEQARARLLDARTRLRGLRLALRRGELMTITDTRTAFMAGAQLAVSRITGLADRLANLIAAEPDPEKVKALLADEARAAIEAADNFVAEQIRQCISR